MITKVIKEIGTVEPEEKNKILNDPDLANSKKIQIIAKMDKFEKNFRERIEHQRISFISALQNFIDTTAPTPEEENNFVKIKVGEYAASMGTCLLLAALDESKNNLLKSISKEFP